MIDRENVNLENGQVPPIKFIDYLSTMTPLEFDNTFFNCLYMYGSYSMLIDELESMKNTYDVCNIVNESTRQFASDDFFEILRHAYLIHFSAGVALSLLTPIGLKQNNFEHIRCFAEINDPIKVIPTEDGPVMMQGVTPAFIGIEYVDNLKSFVQFVKEKFPQGVPVQELGLSQINDRIAKMMDENATEYTLEPHDLDNMTDLVFYSHYLSNAKQFQKICDSYASINRPSDFMWMAMTYKRDKDGNHKDYGRPIDTSYRKPVPQEEVVLFKQELQQLKEELKKVQELQNTAREEFANYERLIIKKYPQFRSAITSKKHR